MTIGLASACFVVFCLWIVFVTLYFKSRADCGRLRRELLHFCEIADLEKHAEDQKAKADAAAAATAEAQALCDQLHESIAAHHATIASQGVRIADQQRDLADAATMLGEYKCLDGIRKQIEKQKHQVNQYNQVLGNFKSAEALKTHIAQQTIRLQELNRSIGKFDSISKLDEHIASQQSQISAFEGRIRDLNDVLAGASTASQLHARITYQQNFLAELQSQTKQVEEALEMQEFGFYRARYDFESSSRYQQKLDEVRDQQTAMVKGNLAVKWEKTWLVEGSDVKGRKMMTEQTKLMLRAFNGECDAAVAKVKYNTATTMESRINRSCQQINKLGKTNSANITDEFLRLKLEELYLVHEHRVKQQQEREEQRRIKEQMRDEEKARREIEEAQEKAARDEDVASMALEKARLAFERATAGQLQLTEQTKAQNTALAAQVTKLENELKEAIDRKAKAIARAQLTKSGHVYILSM